MAHYSFLVMARPQRGREAEWEAWHARHVEDVLKVPGFLSCRRFRVSDFQPSNAEPKWLFAVLYELATDDIKASFAELRARVGTDLMPMSAASDPTQTVTLLLEQISHHG
jgi:aminopeptidase N